MRAFSLIGASRRPETADKARIKGVPQRFARLVIASLCIGLAGCHEDRPTIAIGDPKQGVALIKQNGCGTCHIIPGVEGADGLVGPPLTLMARRIYIAGMTRNTPQNMTIWLQNPQAVVPGNAMPNMGLSQQDARDVTAYLYTLR